MLESIRAIRPTRRGGAVALIALFAFALGAAAGARSLNAVVVPALVALVAGSVQLARADSPTLERTVPKPGFTGERRTVEVAVDSSVPCTVTDAVGDGATAVESPGTTLGHGGQFTYDVELEHRGAYELGPASCRLTDSLGLFSRTTESTETGRGLVYPDVYEVTHDGVDVLVRRILGDDRASFDRLREFGPGDTMRDIDWRASARQPGNDFLVAEYESYGRTDHVRIVGESALGSATAMATGVASLVAHLHDNGISVVVTVPSGEQVAHPGELEPVLWLLAVTGDGWVDGPSRTRADVRVLGKGGSAVIRLVDHDVNFDWLAGTPRGREVVT